MIEPWERYVMDCEGYDVPVHTTHVRVEARKGMPQPDYRVICTCGWQEKAADRGTAQARGLHHERRPHG